MLHQMQRFSILSVIDATLHKPENACEASTDPSSAVPAPEFSSCQDTIMEISSPSRSAAPQAADPTPVSARIRVAITAVVVVIVAALIGVAQFKLGPGKVVLQPMLWALLMSAAWGISARYLPSGLRIDLPLQRYSASLLNAGLLLFVAKLGITVGGSLPQVREAGWGLLFQEFGHAFGTLALGLPLALMLGIKREAVGSTFSVGREPNIAIIGERYGMDSPEGRGVLAEYITGTVLGALFIAVFAGFITSLNIFHPISLAMGAGVGSGSMMAAGVGAIAELHPELNKEIGAVAAASNLLTTVFGFYFTMFLSLPTCSWLYGKLEPVIGRLTKRGRTASAEPSHTIEEELSHAPQFGDSLLAWGVISLGVVIGNVITYKAGWLVSLEGVLIVACVVILCEIAKRLIPRMPLLLVVSVVATLAGLPGLFPFSTALAEINGQINFLNYTTPVLALAGFSAAKDLPVFRRLSWRIVLVSLTATAGTFLGATVVAEFFH